MPPKAKTYKPCQPHLYRDPNSNRCITKKLYEKRYGPIKKSSSKKSSSKKSSSKKSSSKKSSSKKSSSKKSSSKKSSSKKSKSFKPCKSHQVRDPFSNRCINKTTYEKKYGSIKKSSTKKSSAKKSSAKKSSAKKSSAKKSSAKKSSVKKSKQKVSKKSWKKSDLSNFSEFIEKKAFFGGFPLQEKVNFLENMGVIYFVNLTMQDENMTPYETKYNIITYPIKDMGVPILNRQFTDFIFNIVNIIRNLKEDQYMYIHCRGGHGRAGMIVACILIVYLNTTAEHALELTNIFHSKRPFMKARWRKMGSPQTSLQKKFVHRFYKYIKD